MTRYALTVHPDDVAKWLDLTGRDETRPYDADPLHSTRWAFSLANLAGVRIESVRTIPEEES